MRSGTPSWSASTPRRPASIRCRRGSSAWRSRSSPDTPRTFPLVHRYAGAPPQLPLDLVLARLKSWFENPACEKARPERQVRSARARQPRYCARRRRARHDAAVVRARVAPPARHGQPRLAPARRENPELRRRHRKGRIANRFRPGIDRESDRIRGGGYRYHRPAPSGPAPTNCRRRGPRFRLFVDRDADQRSPVSDGAHRCASRLRIAGRTEPRAWASACLRSRIAPTSWPASRSISDRRNSLATYCSEKWVCRW